MGTYWTKRASVYWLFDGGTEGWRMIVCLLLPYFAATLARRERRLPNGVPLILRSGEKVAATCERAAACGVMFGMGIRQAKWLCPDAQDVPLNLPMIRQRSEDVLQTLSQFTHLIEFDKIGRAHV